MIVSHGSFLSRWRVTVRCRAGSSIGKSLAFLVTSVQLYAMQTAAMLASWNEKVRPRVLCLKQPGLLRDFSRYCEEEKAPHER